MTHDWTREEQIKTGRIVERLAWPGYLLSLYYEVWGEVRPLRATFIVELEHNSWREYKAAFDTLEEADKDFDRVKRQHAVEIAKTALRLKRLN